MSDNTNHSKKEKGDLSGKPELTSSSKLSMGVAEHLNNSTLRGVTSIGTLSEFAKQQNALREKITTPLSSTLSALTATSAIYEAMRQQNSLRERIANPLSNAMRAFSETNAVFEVARQQNALREKLNPLFGFQDTLREISKSPLREFSNNSALSIVMGGSTVSTLARLSIEANETPNYISSALDVIKSNQHLFSKQVSIFEKLNRHFYDINKLSTPKWLEQFNSAKDYSKVKTLSAFEILSANTLSQIIGEYPDEEVLTDTEEELDKMGSLIQENEELKSEIEKLLKKVASPPKNKSLKKQLAELEDPIKQFSLYVHLKLFKNSEVWNLKRTYYFIYLMNYIFINIIFSKLLENRFFDSNQQPQSISHVSNTDNRKTINVYSFDSGSVWGIFKKDANVYRRKSIKTDCIGIVSQGTTVRILRKKGEWFFIESAMTKFDKRTRRDVDFVSRGWAKQEVVAIEHE